MYRKQKHPEQHVQYVLKIHSGNKKTSLVHLRERMKKILAKYSSSKQEVHKAWIVFDTEGSDPGAGGGRLENMESLISWAQDSPNCNLAASNPCVEYWFLLHFIDSPKGCTTCKECIRLLKKQMHYRKSSERSIFSSFSCVQIMDMVKNAIRRARRQYRSEKRENGDSDLPNCKGSTVFKLFEGIIQD